MSTTEHTEWDKEYVALIKDKINKGKLGSDSPIVAALIRVIDRLEADRAILKKVAMCVFDLEKVKSHLQHEAEKAELVEALKDIVVELNYNQLPFSEPYAKRMLNTARAALSKHTPESEIKPDFENIRSLKVERDRQ